MAVKLPPRQRVRAVIGDLGMTHQQVADMLGVSRSSVDKWAGASGTRRCPLPCWTLLLLLADQHPDYRLVRRRKPA